MHSFVDTSGRKWLVRVTSGAVRRCRDKLGIALLSDDALSRLAEDPCLLAEVLWECMDKSSSPQVTQGEFEEGLGGETIEQAMDAWMEALFDFFPRGRRDMSRAIYRKVRATQSRMVAAAIETIQESPLDRETIAQLKASSPVWHSGE